MIHVYTAYVHLLCTFLSIKSRCFITRTNLEISVPQLSLNCSPTCHYWTSSQIWTWRLASDNCLLSSYSALRSFFSHAVTISHSACRLKNMYLVKNNVHLSMYSSPLNMRASSSLYLSAIHQVLATKTEFRDSTPAPPPHCWLPKPLP